MQGRPILYKQTSFLFYRPSAVSLASTIADVPFSALQILLFSIIIYFMSGLVRTAGAFFIFYLIVSSVTRWDVLAALLITTLRPGLHDFPGDDSVLPFDWHHMPLV
jgi:ABC-type multidrug transport system permease subunit